MASQEKPNLTKIKSVESTLDELAYALMTAENSSMREMEVERYFEGKNYDAKSMGYVSAYEHHKLQWVMKEFFEESLKFELLKMRSVSYEGEKPPVMMDVEHAPGKTFKAVEDALCYYSQKDEKGEVAAKVIVAIHFDSHSCRYSYTIYSCGLDDSTSVSGKWHKLANEKNFYKGQKISCDCRFLELSDVSWEDVILPPKTLKVIQDNVTNVFEDAEYFKKFNIPLKRGIILQGDPGTGKTQICKAVAKTATCSVVYALPQDFSPNRGGVNAVCGIAKDLAPCILIIEDIDWVAQDRHEGNSGFVIQLMNQLDGLESFGDIITIGTTNHKSDIENAVKNRPGRFDRIISVGNPDLPCRVRMIEFFTRKNTLKDVDVEKISKVLEGLSGAHIKDLCTTASMFAIRSRSFDETGEKLILTDAHFKSAIKEIKNKDFSSYQKVQNARNRGRRLGFSQRVAEPASLEDILFGDEGEGL